LRIANNTIDYQGENPGITLGIRSQQKMISGLIEIPSSDKNKKD
jgi:hypothetical protein